MCYSIDDFTRDRDRVSSHLGWAVSAQMCLDKLETLKELQNLLKPSGRSRIEIKRSLWESIVINYGTIFSRQNNGKAGKQLNPKNIKSSEFNPEIHADLMKLRDCLIAHSDFDFVNNTADTITFGHTEVKIFAGMLVRDLRLEEVETDFEELRLHFSSLRKQTSQMAQEIVTRIDNNFETFAEMLTVPENRIAAEQIEKITLKDGTFDPYDLEKQFARLPSPELLRLKVTTSHICKFVATRNVKPIPAVEMSAQHWEKIKKQYQKTILPG